MKEDIEGGRCFDRRQPATTERGVYRRVCHKKIDRCGTVVAQREADLAIVISQTRGGREGRRYRHDCNGASGPYMKGNFVMMPSEQNSLEQDRECADERTSSTPCLPSGTEPNPCGEARPHFDPMSSAGMHPTHRSQVETIYYNVRTNLRTPLFAKTRFGRILNEPDRRSPMRLACRDPGDVVVLSAQSEGGRE